MASKLPPPREVIESGPDYQRAALAEYERMADEQRAAARDIASLLDSGGELSKLDRMFAAAILRGWAENLPSAPKRKRGKMPDFDHNGAAALYYALTGTGHASNFDAVNYVAHCYGVSEEAIRQCVTKQKKYWVRAVSKPDPPS